MSYGISAAQIPQFNGYGEISEPHPVRLVVGGETCYAETQGFEDGKSVLLCIYDQNGCAMELSLAASEAEKLAALLAERSRN